MEDQAPGEQPIEIDLLKLARQEKESATAARLKFIEEFGDAPITPEVQEQMQKIRDRELKARVHLTELEQPQDKDIN